MDLHIITVRSTADRAARLLERRGKKRLYILAEPRRPLG
jgi:hypothetical protein